MLFAVAGNYGQLVGLLGTLLFVCAGLASAGATVPVQALPGFLRALSHVEPLRQVLAGTRSIMYVGSQVDARLTRGSLAAGIGLFLWLLIGASVARWCDRRHLYRLQPGGTGPRTLSGRRLRERERCDNACFLPKRIPANPRRDATKP